MDGFIEGASTWAPVAIIGALVVLGGSVAARLAIGPGQGWTSRATEIVVAVAVLTLAIGLLPGTLGLIAFVLGPPIT